MGKSRWAGGRARGERERKRGNVELHGKFQKERRKKQSRAIKIERGRRASRESPATIFKMQPVGEQSQQSGGGEAQGEKTNTKRGPIKKTLND